MLSFIYTYSEHPRRNSGTLKTVRIYRIRKNRIEFKAVRTDTFVSEFQLVMEAMEEYKLLPAKAFERSPISNSMIYGSQLSLKEAGIANVERAI